MSPKLVHSHSSVQSYGQDPLSQAALHPVRSTNPLRQLKELTVSVRALANDTWTRSSNPVDGSQTCINSKQKAKRGEECSSKSLVTSNGSYNSPEINLWNMAVNQPGYDRRLAFVNGLIEQFGLKV